MTEIEDIQREIEVLEIENSDLKSAIEALFLTVDDLLATPYLNLDKEVRIREKERLVERGAGWASLWRNLYDDWEIHRNVYLDTGRDISRRMEYNLKLRIIEIISETSKEVEMHRKKYCETGLSKDVAERIRNKTRETRDWLISLIKELKR